MLLAAKTSSDSHSLGKPHSLGPVAGSFVQLSEGSTRGDVDSSEFDQQDSMQSKSNPSGWVETSSGISPNFWWLVSQ